MNLLASLVLAFVLGIFCAFLVAWLIRFARRGTDARPPGLAVVSALVLGFCVLAAGLIAIARTFRPDMVGPVVLAAMFGYWAGRLLQRSARR